MTTPDQDGEHLRLLSIFHYVAGGMMALFSSIMILHVVLGIFLILASQNTGHEPPAALLGSLFVFMGGASIVMGWTLAGLTVYAGRCLASRKRHLFCTIFAGVNCCLVPIGTVLGVFTIIVLNRPTVRRLFT